MAVCINRECAGYRYILPGAFAQITSYVVVKKLCQREIAVLFLIPSEDIYV